MGGPRLVEHDRERAQIRWFCDEIRDAWKAREKILRRIREMADM